MNRNTNAFSTVDKIEVPRSHWPRNHSVLTTFNAGKLVPIYFNEDIIPGTTIKLNLSYVVRMQTPLNPTMDNLILDTYWFWAPKYWYWTHFKEFFGENPNGAWNNTVQYNTPMCNVTTAYGPNDLANYLGVPQGVTGFKYDRIGLSMYQHIWNCWFRSQPLQAPYVYDTSDNDLTSDGTIQTGYGLLPVQKTFDRFTSALPEPQQALPGTTGPARLPLGTSASVTGNGNTLCLTNGTQEGVLMSSNVQNNNPIISSTGIGSAYGATGTGTPWTDKLTIGVSTDPTKSGLIADLSTATAATVNALRYTIALQRLMERFAIYGNFYRDTLRQWGAVASSMDLQIPEYLGGCRTGINIRQQTQTSGTTTSSPLGETGAYSVTINSNHEFTKSMSMHGMIMGLVCVRIDKHKYSQGLPPQFSRTQMLDHYFPEFCHVGNTPILNRQIFLQSDSVVNANGKPVNDDVFGYQEYGQEYISAQDMATGEMNPVYNQTLAYWHYGDLYNSLPVLGNTWIQEDETLIDRTLTVASTEANQFFGDFYIEEKVSAPIPLNRLPGLMDHY